MSLIFLPFSIYEKALNNIELWWNIEIDFEHKYLRKFPSEYIPGLLGLSSWQNIFSMFKVKCNQISLISFYVLLVKKTAIKLQTSHLLLRILSLRSSHSLKILYVNKLLSSSEVWSLYLGMIKFLILFFRKLNKKNSHHQ